MLNIYLTNLGKYNEGWLIGEWLELPATKEEIAAVLVRIGISDKPDKDGNIYEEYFITDYETDIEGLQVDEYESLDRLNQLAEIIDGNEEAVEVLVNSGYDFNQIADNLDKVMYVCTPSGSETDEYAVGYHCAEESGILSAIPEDLRAYFDCEAYGRDIMLNGSFYKAKSGAVYEIVR